MKILKKFSTSWFFTFAVIMVSWTIGMSTTMEFGIDALGDVEDDFPLEDLEDNLSASPPKQLLVTFINNYEEPITLYWAGDKADAKMGIINALESGRFNSFVGHSFFATFSESTERVFPDKVSTYFRVSIAST